MFSNDKDTRLLVLGILLGAGISALYDLFKVYVAEIAPTLPESFVITGGFLGAVGTMGGIFAYMDWNRKRTKSRKSAETK